MAEKPPTAKTLRELPVEDLRQRLAKLRQELWDARLKIKSGAVQQTHLLPRARRQIAQVMTLLKEKHS